MPLNGAPNTLAGHRAAVSVSSLTNLVATHTPATRTAMALSMSVSGRSTAATGLPATAAILLAILLLTSTVQRRSSSGDATHGNTGQLAVNVAVATRHKQLLSLEFLFPLSFLFQGDLSWVSLTLLPLV